MEQQLASSLRYFVVREGKFIGLIKDSIKIFISYNARFKMNIFILNC